RLARPASSSIPDHAPQPSRDRPPAVPTNEMVAGGDGVDAATTPLPNRAATDDGREQTGASGEADDVGTDAATIETQASMESRLQAVAHLCTEFGRVGGRDEILLLLEDAARALDATGLIVWLWDESSEELRPALVHGYSNSVLAHLPTVRRDADNATAAAFRSANTCEVAASAQATGALVVPLLTPEGCAGVLAVELEPGIQPVGSPRATAMILAAALAQLVHRSRPAAQRPHGDRTVPATGKFGPPVRPVKVRR
ncbi:MAG: GAF domain-containing protein, partial [Vicinamibacterales bacterium]